MSEKAYEEALEYLAEIRPATKKQYLSIGPKRIEKLLEKLDNPHKKFQTIHVGGTAGKGSTTKIIAHILKEASYKTGLHLSPHVQDIRERMQINEEFISKDKFVQYLEEIKPVIESMAASQYGKPSHFEALVALAFHCFAKEKVDLAVIEVGLGGTLDGTNVINPLVSVITNVDLDHKEILGKDVETIAGEKAGIIKKESIVITGATQKDIIEIIDKKSKENNCSILKLEKDIKYKIHEITCQDTNFTLNIKENIFPDLNLNLLGEHQVKNAALAIAAVLELKNKGYNISENSIRYALETVKMPLRCEILYTKPEIMIDGAHNPVKIKALVKTLQQIFPKKNISMILAVKKGKDIAEMIPQLTKITKKFYITTYGTNTDFGKKTSINPEELLKHVENIPAEIYKNSQEALEAAIKESKENDLVCVTGSLHLAGELRTILENKKSNQDPRIQISAKTLRPILS